MISLDSIATPAFHHTEERLTVGGDEVCPRVTDAIIEEPLDQGWVDRERDDQPRIVFPIFFLGVAERRYVHREHPDRMLTKVPRCELEVLLPAHGRTPRSLTS